MDYEKTAETLVDRIVALIPEHPEILDLDSPWGLFKVPGFACEDLGPSMAQASFALGKAKAIYWAGADGR
jgi:hypothetical protein